MDKLKKLVIHKITSAWQYVKTFVKWLFIASATGLIGGAIGSLFSICIKYANSLESSLWYLIFLLPLGGVLIVFMYKLCRIENDPGTNCVLESIRSKTTFRLSLLL